MTTQASRAGDARNFGMKNVASATYAEVMAEARRLEREADVVSGSVLEEGLRLRASRLYIVAERMLVLG